jgi:heme/copper-type cytochrome/quinol oxidase subunit 2
MSTKTRKERAARLARRKKIRAATFGVIAALVFGATGYLLTSVFSSKTPPPVSNTIDISADMGGFSMREIRVKAGRPATVRLTSLDNQFHTDGGGRHQWAVDELGVNIIAPPEGSSHSTFTPDRPGTYTFYCDICCGGRANPTMQGTLIVEA